MLEQNRFTHFDAAGHAAMVDLSDKPETGRTAVAQGKILLGPEIFAAVRDRTAAKGDVLGVARVAGIMAAKKTAELIPLCHPLSLSRCAVDFALDAEARAVTAICTVSTRGPTGVEMEALTGASVALLTVYDMCKSIDKGMEITSVGLREKTGGKSGDYRNARFG